MRVHIGKDDSSTVSFSISFCDNLNEFDSNKQHTKNSTDLYKFGKCYWLENRMLLICDVIKQNEQEVSIQFPLYFIVLSITKMALSLEPSVQFWWGFQHNINSSKIVAYIWNENQVFRLILLDCITFVYVTKIGHGNGMVWTYLYIIVE